MPLYCLCHAINSQPDSQAFMAPNRYCAIESSVGGLTEDSPVGGADDSWVPPLALYVPMKVIKTGAQQVLLDGGKQPNDWSSADRPRAWRNHYPNVDLYECPHCGARVCR